MALASLAGVALAVGLAGLGELLAEGLDLRVVARAELVDGAEVLLEGEDVVVSGGGVGFAVIVGVEPLLGGGLEVGVRPVEGYELAGLSGRGSSRIFFWPR